MYVKHWRSFPNVFGGQILHRESYGRNFLVLDLGAPYISEFHSRKKEDLKTTPLSVVGKDDIGKRCLPPTFKEYLEERSPLKYKS
jgi:hypothetical protein